MPPFRFTLVAILSASSGTASTQNLVPNPSFEDTALCDVYDPIRTSAPPWFNPNQATPDIYDNDLERQCGIPWDPANPDVQLSGWQYARTGARFAGAYQWYGPGDSDTKDYFMIQLSASLEPGVSYRVALYYSRAEGFSLATDRISAFFTADSLFAPGWPGSLPYTPQADMRPVGGGYLTEANAWVQVADTFVADGTERYMIIGSFLDSSQVDGIAVSGGADYCYYYYDDVVVEPLEDHVSIPELNVYAMEQGQLRITWPIEFHARTVSLFDGMGRLLRSQEITGAGTNSALLQDMPGMNGIQLVVVQGREGILRQKRCRVSVEP